MSAWHVRSRWVSDDSYYEPEEPPPWRLHRPEWSRVGRDESTRAYRELDRLHDTVRMALGDRPLNGASEAIHRVESRLMARLVAAAADEDAAAAALRDRIGSERAANLAMRALSVGAVELAREPGILEAVREMAAARRAHIFAARNAELRAAAERVRAITAARLSEAGKIGIPRVSRARTDR